MSNPSILYSSPPRANQLAHPYYLISVSVHGEQFVIYQPSTVVPIKSANCFFFQFIGKKKKKCLKFSGFLDLNLMYLGFGESTCQEVIIVLRFDSHIYFCTNFPSRNKIVFSLQCQSAYPPNPSVRYHFPFMSLYRISCHCYMMEP